MFDISVFAYLVFICIYRDNKVIANTIKKFQTLLMECVDLSYE